MEQGRVVIKKGISRSNNLRQICTYKDATKSTMAQPFKALCSIEEEKNDGAKRLPKRLHVPAANA